MIGMFVDDGSLALAILLVTGSATLLALCFEAPISLLSRCWWAGLSVLSENVGRGVRRDLVGAEHASAS